MNISNIVNISNKELDNDTYMYILVFILPVALLCCIGLCMNLIRKHC